MNNHLFPSLVILKLILAILFILIAIPSSYCNEDEQHVMCNHSYTCGQQMQDQNIGYPFWGNNRPSYCGRQGFELKCHENQNTTIQLGDQTFRVLFISVLDKKMTIARDDLFRSDLCLAGIFQETIFNHTLFSYRPIVQNLSLFYDCSGGFSPQGQNNFSCPIESGDHITGFYTLDGDSSLQNRSNSCNKVIKVPFLETDPPLINKGDLIAGRLKDVLSRGLELEYHIDNEFCSECLSSLGICGSTQTSDQFLCLCPDEPHTRTCPGNLPNTRQKLAIGSTTAAVIGIITTATIFFFLVRSKISPNPLSYSFGEMTNSDQDLEAFIRNFGPLALKRFNFSDVMMITTSFRDKLGQGGYGDVYKGKLSDGHLVAVKLLNTSKGNGQEFINELASISRTSHVNVVTLLGYCLEGSKRALIYEFMPNGSLEKFVYSGDTSKRAQHLKWEKMYQIILGIAKGLEYLHLGCNTRILHFDIKPHNILLDEDFCPKISDFGLAKLCFKKESIVSILEARGTIGYIAPEVFCRNFGEVSHKSDVYSYGMMILELVGCRKNLDAGGGNSSELYFPHWIYKHVEQGKDFEWPGVITGEENEIAKKMIIVGLWCIQARPSDRPPISIVLEMLKLSNEDLQIPQMPSLSSPSILIDSSTISTS